MVMLLEGRHLQLFVHKKLDTSCFSIITDEYITSVQHDHDFRSSERGRNILFLWNLKARVGFEPAITDIPSRQLQPLHPPPPPGPRLSFNDFQWQCRSMTKSVSVGNFEFMTSFSGMGVGFPGLCIGHIPANTTHWTYVGCWFNWGPPSAMQTQRLTNIV